jgi:hypothetical protein
LAAGIKTGTYSCNIYNFYAADNTSPEKHSLAFWKK